MVRWQQPKFTCDFIVWTPNEFTVETITFNEKIWKENCYHYLRKFDFDIVLPEVDTLKTPVIFHHLITKLIINKNCAIWSAVLANIFNLTNSSFYVNRPVSHKACRNANANAIQPEVYNTGKSVPRDYC